MKVMILGVLLLLPTFSVHAATGDREGSQDHPLLKRYEGAIILQYDHKQFDEYTVPLAKVVDKPDFSGKVFSKSTRLEGEVTRLLYAIPEGRSALEVMRNYEKDLKGRGFSSLYAVDGKEAQRIQYVDIHDFDRAAGNAWRFGVWKLARNEGDVHVVLYALEHAFGDAYFKPMVKKGQTMLYARVVVAKPLEANKLVGAQEMADQIAETGRVALYGILFDTNKTEIKPESEPTLEEMAKLMKGQPSLKLLVVGHTDNVGTFSSNMDLSQRRAQAVVDTLVSKHAVAKDRLTPYGVSFAAPVAPNKSEEGRAKNRRVELVEQ